MKKGRIVANERFVEGSEGLLTGLIDLDTNKLKCYLIDLDQAGPAAGAWVITAVTNAVNPTITTQVAHGLVVGDRVAISGVVGAVGVNGNFDVLAVPTSTTFTVTAAAPGAYTSGGRLMNLSKTFVSEISVVAAARVAVSAALTGASGANGVFDANDTQFPSVPALAVGNNQAEGVVIAAVAPTTGAADDALSAQRLIHWMDSGSGFPITPNGNNIDLIWDNTANRIFRI